MKHRNTPKKTTTTNWKRDKKDRIRWHRQREREREVYWKSIVYCTGIGIVCNCMHKHQEFESNQRMNVAVVAITSALCTVWTCFALFQFSSLYVVCVFLLFHTDLTKRKDYSLSIIRCPNKSATASVWQYILLFSFRCSVINCVLWFNGFGMSFDHICHFKTIPPQNRMDQGGFWAASS